MGRCGGRRGRGRSCGCGCGCLSMWTIHHDDASETTNNLHVAEHLKVGLPASPPPPHHSLHVQPELTHEELWARHLSCPGQERKNPKVTQHASFFTHQQLKSVLFLILIQLVAELFVVASPLCCSAQGKQTTEGILGVNTFLRLQNLSANCSPLASSSLSASP